MAIGFRERGVGAGGSRFTPVLPAFVNSHKPACVLGKAQHPGCVPTACIQCPPDMGSSICHRIHQLPPKNYKSKEGKGIKYPPVCPSVCLCVHPYVHLRDCVSICVTVCPPVRPCVHPGIHLCAQASSVHLCLSVSASICASMPLSIICVFVCMSAYASVPACASVSVSICASVSVCASICASLCAHLSVHLHTQLCICLCIRPCIHMSTCASACTSVCLPVHPSVCASMFPPVHPTLCTSMRRSVCLPVTCCPLPLGVTLPGSAICHPCTSKGLFHGPRCPHGGSSRRMYMQGCCGWLMETTQRCNQRENCLSLLFVP